MKLNYLLLILFGAISFLNCTEKKPYSEDEAQLAVPDAVDLPKTELSNADRAKIAAAQGKTVEALDFATFEKLIQKNKEDKLYIYNFWATWCKPCVEEMPYFERLQTVFKDKVKVIFVSLDNPKLLQKRVIPFVREKQIQAQVILLSEPLKEDSMNKISKLWEGGSIPATLLVNQAKSIRVFHEQEFTFEELKAVITPLIF